MIFRFHGRCLDCGHEWDGLKRRIVCGRLDQRDTDTCWCYQCAKCFVELYVPRQTSRSRWLRWVSQNASELTRWPLEFTACELGVRVDLQSLDVISRSKLLFVACERVSIILAQARSPYVPVPIDIGTLECPDCGDPMAIRDHDADLLICPCCDHRSVVSTKEQHAGIVPVDYSPLASEDVRRLVLHLRQLAEPPSAIRTKMVLALPEFEGMEPLWDRQLDG